MSKAAVRRPVIDGAAIHQERSYARPAMVGGVVALVATIWFTALSGWLGITPRSVVLSRQNILFNSDTNAWVSEMVNGEAPSSSGRAIHPLAVVFWRPPSRMFSWLLRAVVPPEQAAVLGARFVIALVAGAGLGCLAWLAVTLGLTPSRCFLLCGMYLLFTSNSTAALPEHFGISNGLLAMAFALPALVSAHRVRAFVLGTLTVLCVGTTLTNALYPLAGLYQWSVPSARVRRAVIAVLIVILPVAVFLFIDSRKVVLLYTDADKGIAARVAVLPRYLPGITGWYLKTTKMHGHIVDYLNLRLVSRPVDAATYAMFAVVAPAVGPPPAVRKTKGADMVTYESEHPLHWNPNGYFTGSDGVTLVGYIGVQGIGAAMWAALFLICAYQAFRDPGTRSLAWLPAGWIIFNLIFHNLWGDELFLYAPHWSWALMALVLLGARRLSLATVAAFVIPIAVCQIVTLLQIKHALLAIV